jgi:uncharacterized protein YbaP (TraB family)
MSDSLVNLASMASRAPAALRLACVLFAAFAPAAGAAGPTAECPPMAQAPSPELAAQAGAQARDRGFLWRLRKDGRDSYLYGTVHVGKLGWIFPGPGVAAALAHSDLLALEMDPLDPTIQQTLAQGMATQAGPAAPAALRERLARDAEAECLPAQTFAALSPERQALALAALAGRRDGLDPAFGIDIALASLSRAAGRPTVSLETPELQLAALHSLGAQDTLAFIESTLDELEQGRARPTLLRIAKLWADSDLDDLEHYTDWCACFETPADRTAMAHLLDDRNPGLADGIGALHDGGMQVFAAVGSLHMIGPLGLPALLARRGFVVERVPPQPGSRR